jgi:hypothetical protein
MKIFALVVLASSALFACVAQSDGVDCRPSEIGESARPQAEFLHPGVYVEETQFRRTPIPGVTTGTTWTFPDGGSHLN